MQQVDQPVTVLFSLCVYLSPALKLLAWVIGCLPRSSCDRRSQSLPQTLGFSVFARELLGALSLLTGATASYVSSIFLRVSLADKFG